MITPPVVLAGAAEGTDADRSLADLAGRVRALLPGVQVEAGLARSAGDTIEAALGRALAGGEEAVIVPLTHGATDPADAAIAGGVADARAAFPDATVARTRPLGTPRPPREGSTPADELAEAVARRYREGAMRVRAARGSHVYLTGLRLTGRAVVVVGGGCVARRTVTNLLEAGAVVTVVAPELHERLDELAASGAITWQARDYADGDLDGAWYVLAATEDPATNARVAADAEARHTFCVRTDEATSGTAWTPTTGDHDGIQIAVVTPRDPGRSRRVRDRVLALVEQEGL
ncbi:MAG: NAD(P)-dependent oxidoreductase [Propioniciclava sp.]|uniref:NAD(P)-dependent oxidoreductase n=1 Tax=Propioniciclava sp. TaxID=2038686 RepID=UPI0039E26571